MLSMASSSQWKPRKKNITITYKFLCFFVGNSLTNQPPDMILPNVLLSSNIHVVAGGYSLVFNELDKNIYEITQLYNAI